MSVRKTYEYLTSMAYLVLAGLRRESCQPDVFPSMDVSIKLDLFHGMDVSIKLDLIHGSQHIMGERLCQETIHSLV